jgi:GDPmannose 4,6-dehydratase
MKKALITGITGQDGSYLCELLLSKGYEVHGIIRRSSNFNTQRIDHIIEEPNLHLHYGDLLDADSLSRVLTKIRPKEIYNLACQSHVRVSFDIPVFTVDTVAMGTIRLLEAIRSTLGTTDVCYYQASSSELFGSSPPPQNENTPFQPRSPYACAKAFAYYQVINYRESYGLHASNGILYNHESPRRGETFVSRKITRAATRIKYGLQDKLYLGNLAAKRDWGYAKEYVKAMWLILQQEKPDDYIIATGEMYSVRDFLEETFKILGLDWRKYVEIDQKYFRPAEVDALQGDATKARTILGWQNETKFKDLVKLMVQSDLELARKERAIRNLSG